MKYIFETKMEVRDYECDIEGIVNNANYLSYTEHTRHLFLKQCGLSFAEMHAKGVDAVVAEGFEAGGHNGREETTTMCLIPAVRKATTLPLMAAGGIGNGPSMLAAYALGAEGVQIGTRFALTAESSASEAFKNFCLNLEEGDTMLILKKLSPTRMAKNPYREQLDKAEADGATAEQLLEIIGVGRNRMGIFEGDLVNGEVAIGQNASQFKGKGIQTVAEVMHEMLAEYEEAKQQLLQMSS